MIINVGAYADKEISRSLSYWADVRSETLRRLCSMPEYSSMSREEANRMYDKIRSEVEEEIA